MVLSMGDPRKFRNKFKGPRHPWNKVRLQEEIVLVGKYGLRNKHELWRAQTILSQYRTRARQLLALPEEEREAQLKVLIDKLYKLGVLPSLESSVDEVLSLTVEDFLKRRLQTMVKNLGLASTIHQARQLIVHGHIAIKDRRVTIPSYHVKRGEEDFINYAPGSPFLDPNHPLRKKMEESTGTSAGSSSGE